jgi:hypothetical protein
MFREDAMRTLTQWTLTAALALGAAAAGAAAQEPAPADTPAESGWKLGWPFRWFGGKKPEAKKPAPKEPAPKVEDTEPQKALQSAAARLEHEMAELKRRQDVCDKLRTIGIQTGDEALVRRAEQLDQRAWALYQQRTGAPPVPGTSFQSDEQTLAQRLNPHGSPAGSGGVPASFGLGTRDTITGRTAARGEQP